MSAWPSPYRLGPQLALVALGALLGGGCVAHTERGETLYREGRHIEAAEVFELTEGRLAASPADDCACYGLYRGLNFLKLGDLRSARHWLDYTERHEKVHPGMLSEEEKGLLADGWRELGRRDHMGPVPRAAAGFAPSGTTTPDHSAAPKPPSDPSIADQ